MEKREELLKLKADIDAKLAEINASKGQEDGQVKADAIMKDELMKMKNDLMQMLKDNLPAKEKKTIFGRKAEAKEGEERISLGKFMLMAKYNDPRLVKTIMSEGTNAQGGYTVPVEYANEILGYLNEDSGIMEKCTPFFQNTWKKEIPKWLTDMTVYWVAEGSDKTASKPTFTQKESLLKKICALIEASDEYLSDQNVQIEQQLQKLVAENIKAEINKIILVGDVSGVTDPFNGIYFSTGIKSANQAGANLAYSDLVGVMLNKNVISRYKTVAEWFMNETALALIINMVDGNGRPLWNINTIQDSPYGSLLGRKINLSNEIPDTLGTTQTNGTTTGIIYGDLKNVILGRKQGEDQIQLAVSNSAVISSSTTLVTNAWVQDTTMFRFVYRNGVLVANPEAFSVLKSVK